MKAIILLGMTGNLLILVTVARSPAMRTTSNIYICNMAISGEDTGEMFNSLLEISELCNSQVWITLSVNISFLEIKSFQLLRHGDLPFQNVLEFFLHLLRHGDIFAPAQTWWSAWRQPRWPPSPPSPAAGTLGGSHASCFPSFRLRTFYWKFLVLLKVLFKVLFESYIWKLYLKVLFMALWVAPMQAASPLSGWWHQHQLSLSPLLLKFQYFFAESYLFLQKMSPSLVL